MTPPAEPTHTRIQQFAIYVAAFLLAAPSRRRRRRGHAQRVP